MHAISSLLQAHVCVEQTAAELCARGYKVHIVADATTSRSQEDRLLAFEVFNLRKCEVHSILCPCALQFYNPLLILSGSAFARWGVS